MEFAWRLWTFSGVQETFPAGREKSVAVAYNPDPDVGSRRQNLLGLENDSATEFWQLWNEVIASLRARVIKVGPFSFHEWNDGDAGFVRAIWRGIRHSRAHVVIEAGVAQGVRS